MNKPTKAHELPSFETIEQLMSDSYLKGRIQEKIDYINKERDRVSDNGKKLLKPSPTELLIKINKFTKEFITNEFILIHNKQSHLPHAIRQFITLTIQECTGETFTHYEKLFQKQNKKLSKSKKS